MTSAESIADSIAELCDRIDAVDADLHAFVPEPDRRTRLAAEVARAEPGEALYGVPVGVKDVIRVDGLETRAGSRLPAEVFAGTEASAVSRLRAAGALVAGKTVTAEFAFFAPGPTRNPHDPRHTPGGSSSGSAAAVAAGLVPLALGTQTIGSVIRPAAYCGTVGFKPSYGRIPVDGVVPNAPSLDTVGVLAVDVDHTTRAAAVLCDGWRPVPPTGPPVLGVPDGRYLAKASDPARAAFEAQLESLATAGFRIRRVPALDDIDDIIERNHAVNLTELARVHATWFESYGQLYHERTADAIEQGRRIPREAYERGLAGRAELARELAARQEADRFDLWAAPAATGPAPADLTTTGSPLMNLPWTYAGLPVLCLPGGRTSDGLPLGIQFVGRTHTDERLLAWAPRLAAALGASG